MDRGADRGGNRQVMLRTTLLPWQQAAVDKLLPIRVGALYMDMGTGKTRTALEMIQRRLSKGKLERVLWLCPCSVQANLKRDLDKHAEGWQSVIRIAGIESLSGSYRLFAELSRYVAGAETMLVVDESNLVKNHHAIRSQRVTDIAERCRYRVILNGTPISRNEKDLYSQWYLLDWRILGYRSFWSFAANHLEYDKDRPGLIRRALNVDYLVSKIAPYCYQVSREECMTLPAKQYEESDFAMTEEQVDHYGIVAEQLIAELDEQRPSTIYRLFSALQAICSGRRVALNDKHMTTAPMFAQPSDNPRIQCLLSLMDGMSDQVIIFCKYQHEIDDLHLMMGDRAVTFDGRLPQRQRQAALNDFAAGRPILLCNKQCAGYGLNLQFCHRMIFYSNDWDYATRIQAEDRVHRLGQEHPVQITDVYARESLEIKILSCLSRKEGLVGALKRQINHSNDIREDLRAWARGVIDT